MFPIIGFAQEPTYIPWGCVKFNDSIFIKQSEVSIADYFSFLLDIWDSQYDEYHRSEKQKDLLELLFLPKDNKTLLEFSSGIPQEVDTSYYWFFEILKRSSDYDFGDLDEFTINGKSFKRISYYSSRHYSLKDFDLYLTETELEKKDSILNFLRMPITGVDYDRAIEYSVWYAKTINDYSDGVKSNSYDGPKGYYKYQGYLPYTSIYSDIINEHKEYFKSAVDKKNEYYVVGDSVNKKGCPIFNFQLLDTCNGSLGKINQYGKLNGPVAIDSYNTIGKYSLLNILGNVQEMTAKEGVAMGGSYEMLAKNILNNKEMNYDSVNKFTGFRPMIIRNSHFTRLPLTSEFISLYSKPYRKINEELINKGYKNKVSKFTYEEYQIEQSIFTIKNDTLIIFKSEKGVYLEGLIDFYLDKNELTLSKKDDDLLFDLNFRTEYSIFYLWFLYERSYCANKSFVIKFK
tara:strand:+ start:96 stop:1472 length:1377 start_codon:yes stop_codon:yes gene_type:complete